MPSAHQSIVTDLLFVYGTLMKGFQNRYARQLRQQSQFVGQGSLPGQLYQIIGFPGAVPDPLSASRIHGEVYQLDNPAETLLFLDEYEDVAADGSGMYIRQQCWVEVGKQQLVCWVYTYNESIANLVPIEGGEWRMRNRKKRKNG